MIIKFKLKFYDLKGKYNIRLGRSDNVVARRQRFIQRINEIEEHNAGDNSYKLEINEFAHLSDEELSQRTGLIFDPETQKNGKEIEPSRGGRSYPESWDWRNYTAIPNVVRPVLNQGNCGNISSSSLMLNFH